MTEGVTVIVGANRGIGLALVKQLKTAGHTILATARKDGAQLRDLEVEAIEGVEVTAEGGFQAVTAALGDRLISLLIVAAGTQEVDTFETVSKDCIRRQLDINALGPLFAVKALLPRFQKQAKVVLLSSRNASITDVEATGGELYGYRISKVALNMIGRTLAGDLKRLNGSPVGLVHPGVVNTDMLRSLRKQRGVAEEKLTANTLEPDESARRIIKLINSLNLENSGTYWSADSGEIMPW